MYSLWSDVCNNQLESLKNQWYGVLRMECLVAVLNSTDQIRAAAIDACKALGRTHYDQAIDEAIWLPGCSNYTKEPHIASTDPFCETLKEPYSNMNMSGVEVYEDYWYSGFIPGNCVSDCCFPTRRDEVVPPYVVPASLYMLPR